MALIHNPCLSMHPLFVDLLTLSLLYSADPVNNYTCYSQNVNNNQSHVIPLSMLSEKNHPNIVDPLVLDYPHPVLYANYLKIQCKDTFFTSVPILLHICRLTISSLDSTQSSDLPLSQLFRLKSKFILHSQFEGTCQC